MTQAYKAGFNKTAEAFGINGNTLLKAAQQFKTDGWAPEQVAQWGTHAKHVVPRLVEDDDGNLHYHPQGRYSMGPDNISMDMIANLLNSKDPRQRNWFISHQIASKARRDAEHSKTGKNTTPVYHDTMMTLTGTPQKVTAPAPHKPAPKVQEQPGSYNKDMARDWATVEYNNEKPLEWVGPLQGLKNILGIK